MSRATWIVPTTALAAGLGFSLFAAPANAADPQNGWGDAARAVAQCEEIGGMGTHASGGFGDERAARAWTGRRRQRRRIIRRIGERSRHLPTEPAA